MASILSKALYFSLSLFGGLTCPVTISPVLSANFLICVALTYESFEVSEKFPSIALKKPNPPSFISKIPVKSIKPPASI